MSYRPTCTGDWNPHAAVAEAPGGLIGQLVGLPAPPRHVVFIPKYTPCTRGGPWRRPGSAYCRSLAEYGPRGIAHSLASTGLTQWEDPAYSAPMPYASLDSTRIVCPREAAADALAKGSIDVVAVVHYLASRDIPPEALGLTGSHAAGIAVPGLSDVDLILYTDEYGDEAPTMARTFESLRPASPPRGEFGGVRVEPPAPLGWRRAVIEGIPASWVGVPARAPAAHCNPLRGYPPPDPPEPQRRATLNLSVRPGQTSALLYPPCVEAADGTTILSLEYNLGITLYRGGSFRVKGVLSLSGSTVYLGLREEPGAIKRL